MTSQVTAQTIFGNQKKSSVILNKRQHNMHNMAYIIQTSLLVVLLMALASYGQEDPDQESPVGIYGQEDPGQESPVGIYGQEDPDQEVAVGSYTQEDPDQESAVGGYDQEDPDEEGAVAVSADAVAVSADAVAASADAVAQRGIIPWRCSYYWGGWGSWSRCSVSCGKGVQTRTRRCYRRGRCILRRPGVSIVSSSYCRRGLQTNIQIRQCDNTDRNGGWSNWGCWGTCKNGTRQRHRVCNRPLPSGWGTFCVGSHTATENCSVPLESCLAGQDVVFLIDESGSIGRANFNLMIRDVKAVIQQLDLDAGSGPLTKVRVGIALFDRNQLVLKHLNNFNLPAAYPYNGGGTNIAAAITFARNTMFTLRNGDRPSAPNTLVVITDGRSANPIPAATAAKNAGIKIKAIGVGNRVNLAHLRGIVSDVRTDIHTTPNFCYIARELQKIFNCTDTQAPRRRYIPLQCRTTIIRARAFSNIEAEDDDGETSR